MAFSVPVELARLHPQITRADRAFVNQQIQNGKNNEEAFKALLDSKGISYQN